MKQICIWTFVSACILYYSNTGTVSATTTGNNPHSLLRDPIDEEHDDLATQSDDTHAYEWTLQIEKGNDDTAKRMAGAYGFDVVSKIGVGGGVYRFLNSREEKREKLNNSYASKREMLIAELDRRLKSDKRIMWYKRERILVREKRVPADYQVQSTPNRDFSLDDPQFPNQWYIRNDGQTEGPAAFDSNVVPVWNMGYTGKGVKLSVLDDGMDHTHPDLVKNYDPLSSKDLNGHDNDPFPNDSDPYNAHGTKCSGTIAATWNNSLCGVGIAPNSQIGAIRMLDGKATDALEADALSFHRDHIDIYSCSWGPKDNGKTFGRPGNLGRVALAQGVKFGRNGLGSLFVWATGNGGMQKDDCNADGYVNSIFTLGIGSVNEHGVSTYYGEHCSAMMAVTYCSGKHSIMSPNGRANVITTYLHHQCTQHFVGTSSAAPLAAGILALVVEANPRLTWRDVQHLVFHTAKVTSPLDPDWKKNGCGKHFNHKFGFGLLDAYLLVNLALNWTRVDEQRRCHFRLNFKNGDIPSKRHFKLNFTTDACQSCAKNNLVNGTCRNAVKKLEHVQVDVTLKHRRRGDLKISLISPHGTVSHLLRRRPYDSSDSGLKGWRFMTVFNWCENPSGTWQLVFEDGSEDYNSYKKRDMEDEYIQYLDNIKRTKNKKGSEKRTSKEDHEENETKHRNIFDMQSDDDEDKNGDGFTVNAQRVREAEKREVRDRYHHDRNYRRAEDVSRDEYLVEDPYYAASYRRRDYDINDNRYDTRRVRREESVKKTDIDESHLQQMEQGHAGDMFYKNPILKRSQLAGEVQKISVTFYGTA